MSTQNCKVRRLQNDELFAIDHNLTNNINNVLMALDGLPFQKAVIVADLAIRALKDTVAIRLEYCQNDE